MTGEPKEPFSETYAFKTGAYETGYGRQEHSGSGPDTNETAAPEIGAYALDFAVAKSIRYHAKMRRFFDRLHQISVAISALTASAAVATLTVAGGDRRLALWLSAAVACVTTLDLVIGFSERARTYDGLLRRFSDLRVRLVRNPAPSTAELRILMADRLEIEKDEPTERTVLNLICNNEELVARGFPRENEARVSWWRRQCAYLIDLPPPNPRPAIAPE